MSDGDSPSCAAASFRMRFSPTILTSSAEEMRARALTKVELDELLKSADFVSINCPLTDESRGMIGAREFALMRPHTYFVTTARGFIHDEDALAQALRDKKIAGAGLDVWDKEPPPADHPLMQFDNVHATAAHAGVTREARINMGRIAAEQVLDALDGKPVKRIVNPRVWPDYAKRFEPHLRLRSAESDFLGPRTLLGLRRMARARRWRGEAEMILWHFR
jgi:phosphoglycerate dehydrogenase-like enzyme